MMQIVVTLENDADTSLLIKMIENMKGVIKTNLLPFTSDKDDVGEWMENLHSIKKVINPSLIDMKDDRTNYIMSK